MVKSKNIIAGLGVVAGLGMALLPLGAFAANEQTGTQVVRATVGEVFELTVTSNKTDMTKTGTGTLAVTPKGSANAELTHTVNVKGNLYKGYDLKLSSVDSSTDLKFVKDDSQDFGAAARYDTSTKIATGTTLSGDVSAWAYKKSETSGSFTGDWTTIKAVASPDTLKSNENAGHASFDDTVYVNYGVYAAENQAAGVYEAEVIYKATPKP